eukprot:365320-Chlamydomonas_euryale.AAC.1
MCTLRVPTYCWHGPLPTQSPPAPPSRLRHGPRSAHQHGASAQRAVGCAMNVSALRCSPHVQFTRAVHTCSSHVRCGAVHTCSSRYCSRAQVAVWSTHAVGGTVDRCMHLAVRSTHPSVRPPTPQNLQTKS